MVNVNDREGELKMGRWKNREINLLKPEAYEQIKDSLYLELVGIERHEKALAKMVYTQIEDMAIIYGMQVQEKSGKYMGYLFSEDMLKSMKITKQQLHHDAMENTMKMWPATIHSIVEIVDELADLDLLHPEHRLRDMYIVSNEPKYNGAAALFYPKVMETISQKIGGDYYVLPSSLHEMFVLADDGKMTPEELQHSLHEINWDIDESDVLTDQVYHYDARHKIFELATVYAWKKENERKFWEQMRVAL